MDAKSRIIVALDVTDLGEVERIVKDLSPEVGAFKVGYQLGYSVGWQRAYELICGLGSNVFLDVKLHDIPNTVGMGIGSLAAQSPWMLNLHCSAGEKALTEANKQKGDSLLFGVTILTSTSEEECQAIYGAGTREKISQFASWAVNAGLDGLICSPSDLSFLTADTRLTNMSYVTPGVRPHWAAANDQKRISSPAQAIKDGADYLVIGRPILQPPSKIGGPVEATRAIVREIEEATTA